MHHHHHHLLLLLLLLLLHHHHHVPEGFGVFRVPWSSRWSWAFHLSLGRPMFLRPFRLYCSACFGSLFVSILCTCCSHFFRYCYIIQNACEHITYLLTPWCRALLEKLTGLQLVKKSPAFHGTRRFITALTSVRHLSLSWASPIQSIYPHPTSWRSILLLSTHLRLCIPSGLLPSGFPSNYIII